MGDLNDQKISWLVPISSESFSTWDLRPFLNLGVPVDEKEKEKESTKWLLLRQIVNVKNITDKGILSEKYIEHWK